MALTNPGYTLYGRHTLTSFGSDLTPHVAEMMKVSDTRKENASRESLSL